MADAVKLIIDGARVEELLRSPTGPLAINLIARATRFQAAARATLAPHRDTGCLEDGVVKRLEESAGGIAVRVMTDTVPCSPSRTAYGLYVEMGTDPHDIRPKQSGGVLAFQVAGETVFARSVRHPGTAPVKFFTDNLAAFGDF